MALIRFFHLIIFLFPTLLYGQSDSLTTNGVASFYHDKFHGRETSNGEFFNKNDFTSAHRTLPFNTILRVTNKKNNKSVVVRINDRGPFKKSRIIDLSQSAAKKLDMVLFGVVPVKIQPLTYLDRINFSDSLIKENEVWDCFANKIELNDSSIFVWQTESIKHAFYMASDILLSYKFNDVYVRVAGTGKNRKYIILIPLSETRMESMTIIKTLMNDGFRFARITP